MIDPVNPMTLQFVDHGFSTVDTLHKGSGIWSPAYIFIRPSDVAHCNTPDNNVGKSISVEGAVSAKSDYSVEKYKTDFEIWRENIRFERQNIARSQPPLDSTTVGVKTSDTKH